MLETEFIEKVKRLRLKKGDVLVLRTNAEQPAIASLLNGLNEMRIECAGLLLMRPDESFDVVTAEHLATLGYVPKES